MLDVIIEHVYTKLESETIEDIYVFKSVLNLFYVYDIIYYPCDIQQWSLYGSC